MPRRSDPSTWAASPDPGLAPSMPSVAESRRGAEPRWDDPPNFHGEGGEVYVPPEDEEGGGGVYMPADPIPRCWVCPGYSDSNALQEVCGWMLDENAATFVLDHLEGYMEMKHRCVPPRTVCNPKEKENICGPEVGEAFKKDLDRLVEQVLGSQNVEINFGYDGLNLRSEFDGDMTRMSYPPGSDESRPPIVTHPRNSWYTTVKYQLLYKWMDFGSGGGDEECPKGKCAGTVQLNGICVPQNALGNIGAGYLVKKAAAEGLWPLGHLDRQTAMQLLLLAAGAGRDNTVAIAMGADPVLDPNISANDMVDNWSAFFDMMGMGSREEYDVNRHVRFVVDDVFGIEDLIENSGGSVGLRDMQITRTGADTGECDPCSSPVIRSIDARKHFEDLRARCIMHQPIGGTGPGLNDWLEKQVPAATRNPRTPTAMAY